MRSIEFIPSKMPFYIESSDPGDVEFDAIVLKNDHCLELSVSRRRSGLEYILILGEGYEQWLNLVIPQEANKR